MANLVIRPFEPQDADGVFAVRSLTYNDGLPVPEDRRQPKWSDWYVAALDNQIVGSFNVLPMTASRGTAVLGNGGVAGVAVSPDVRRGGIGKAMMDWLPGHLRRTGIELASLYAFRETFYAKSGYAVVGKRLKVTVPAHRMPVLETSLPVRRLAPEDWQEIHACHAAFAANLSGVHVRSESMWERVLNESKPLAIYAAGDPIEGYIAVSHSTAFWVPQWISEVAWTSRRGYEACLAMMRQVGINKTALEWHEPSDSPYCARFLDQGVQVAVERPVMFRVCDVPGGLRKLRPSATGSFTIRVSDTQVPENEGPWRVTFSPADVTVEATTEADLEMDIRPFSQAFMGEPSLEQLARMGMVEVRDPAALASAASLLTPASVFCSDFF